MGQFTYDYPRPAVTVDVVVFAIDGDDLSVLLIRRGREPFAGRWALPGGFVEIDEPFEQAARRELTEETRLVADGPLAFLGVFGRPGRDPRGRTLSIAHATVMRSSAATIRGSDDASDAAWRPVAEAVGLAFDHDEILASGRAWLSERVLRGRLGLAMLPGPVEKADLMRLYRAVVGPGRLPRGWLDGLLGPEPSRPPEGDEPPAPTSYSWPLDDAEARPLR